MCYIFIGGFDEGDVASPVGKSPLSDTPQRWVVDM